MNKGGHSTDNGALKILQENTAAMNTLSESSRAMQTLTGVGSAFEALQNNGVIHAIGELAMKSAIPAYQFDIPALKAIEAWSNSVVANLAVGLNALVTSPVIQEIQSISSRLGKWLQTVDFSPLTSILENIQDIGFDYDYEEIKVITALQYKDKGKIAILPKVDKLHFFTVTENSILKRKHQ